MNAAFRFGLEGTKLQGEPDGACLGVNGELEVGRHKQSGRLGIDFVRRPLPRLKRMDVPDEYLGYLSPLGWEHINLTGDYIWNLDP